MKTHTYKFVGGLNAGLSSLRRGFGIKLLLAAAAFSASLVAALPFIIETLKDAEDTVSGYQVKVINNALDTYLSLGGDSHVLRGNNSKEHNRRVLAVLMEGAVLSGIQIRYAEFSDIDPRFIKSVGSGTTFKFTDYRHPQNRKMIAKLEKLNESLGRGKAKAHGLAKADTDFNFSDLEAMVQMAGGADQLRELRPSINELINRDNPSYR
jgi:hypothetical protein